MAANPLAALVAYLRADADVAALVGVRVFGRELPRAETDAMPRQAVVLKRAGGGLLGRGYQEYGDIRVDVYCYGATGLEADELHDEVRAALKHRLRATVAAGVLLHWARPSSDGSSGREPDTDWPLTVSSWQLLSSDVDAG